MVEQCLKCYYASDRSTKTKQIIVCDQTMHHEYLYHNIFTEIPKDYNCSYSSYIPKPLIQIKKERKPYTKKVKQ